MLVTRVAVFFDGNYLYHGSNHLKSVTMRRPGFDGLHRLFRQVIAKEEGCSTNTVQITESHYFRGRTSPDPNFSNALDVLSKERVFDLIMISAGVQAHYLPVRSRNGSFTEKGIDVALAVEAFDLASQDKYDVAVVVSGDEDFVPLVRKINALGKRTFIGYFQYQAEVRGEPVQVRPSGRLLSDSTYSLDIVSTVLGNEGKEQYDLTNFWA